MALPVIGAREIDEAIWGLLNDDGEVDADADSAPSASRRRERRERREASAQEPSKSRPPALDLSVLDDSTPAFTEALTPRTAAAIRNEDTVASVETAPVSQLLPNAAFLLLGIGVSIAWTALRSGIVYYRAHFALQSAFFTVLTAAYNVPALPMLLAQMAADEAVDSRVGKTRALTFRFVISLSVMAGGCLLLAAVRTQALVLGVTVATGLTNAAAFGSSLQFFSLFPAAAGGYYFMGSSLSSLVAIALTFATGFQATEPSPASFATFYAGAGAVVLIGLAAVLFLLFSRAGAFAIAQGEARAAAAGRAVAAAGGLQLRSIAADKRKEESLQPLLHIEDGEGGALALRAGSFDEGEDEEAEKAHGSEAAISAPPSTALSLSQILRATAVCHFALGLCWACTTAVDGLLDVVPTAAVSGSDAARTFRLLLLYASLLGELTGKQLNVVRVGGRGVAKTPAALLCAVALRAAAAVAFMLYVLQPRLTATGGYAVRIDGLAIAFQAAFDCTGAYLSSVAYTIAGKQISPAARSQSAIMLGISVTLGVYVGLAVAYAIASVTTTFSTDSTQRGG